MKKTKNKIEKNILIAFFLNLFFSIFEFIGGIVTNSIAISSDAIHDLGDAISIGISYILERKSKQKADEKYTYGYSRYSVLGGVITTVILLIGSIIIIYNAILRLINPTPVNYSGMIVIAIIGVVLNTIAALVTKEGESINQKAVNLHMLEDVLGWVVVLIGSILMNFFNISYLDSIMSIGISVFIFISALKNLKKVLDVFLERTPVDININEIKEELMKIKGIEDVYDIHIWSMDGYNNYATMHVVSKSKNLKEIKSNIKQKLLEDNICHVIIETEEERCGEEEFHIK